MPTLGPASEAKIDEVVAACQRYGESSIIALAGVPGTGKSTLALPAAQRVASDPLMVTEVQFHPAYGYDEFIEGLRIDSTGAVVVREGVFLEVNRHAREDPGNTYVLLIEEFTRANVHSVLGEVLTYIEHRGRPMTTLYGRVPVPIEENVRVIATYNPADRTALDLDAAMLRRLRIIDFPPDVAQLDEMLAGKPLSDVAKSQLRKVFTECEKEFKNEFAHSMPFGHGIFAEVTNEVPDLYELWRERIVHMLRRPQLEPHPFTDIIEAQYPWRDPTFTATTGASAAPAASEPAPTSTPSAPEASPAPAASPPAGSTEPSVPPPAGPSNVEGEDATQAETPEG